MGLKKYARFVFIAGIATFISMALIIIMSGGEILRPAEYPNEQGFTQAIFWFELLESADEIQYALGDASTDEGKHIRQAMDITNKYDFIFMFFYPLLYAALFLFLHKKMIYDGYRISNIRIIVLSGLFFSLIMFLSDIYENIQLFKIASYTDLNDIKPELIAALQISTRIKSLAISGGTLILIGFYLIIFKKSWKIVLPLIYCVSVVLSIAAFTASSNRYLIESAASLGMLGWLISTIHGGYWSFKAYK